jgi:hypothetical protein
MNCRALGFAAVLLLVCGGLTRPLQAQENLDAGKSPSQLFAGNCSACHKSPRGLLKTIPAGSLQGFLRQHYTTSPEMAGVLAGYLTANGAGDTRGGKGARESKPDTETTPSERTGRKHRRSATEPGAAEQAAPAPAAAEQKPHPHRRSARHKHGNLTGDEAKPNAANEPSEEAARPAAESQSEAPKVAAPKESEPAPTTTQSTPSAGAADPAH